MTLFVGFIPTIANSWISAAQSRSLYLLIHTDKQIKGGNPKKRKENVGCIRPVAPAVQRRLIGRRSEEGWDAMQMRCDAHASWALSSISNHSSCSIPAQPTVRVLCTYKQAFWPLILIYLSVCSKLEAHTQVSAIIIAFRLFNFILDIYWSSSPFLFSQKKKRTGRERRKEERWRHITVDAIAAKPNGLSNSISRVIFFGLFGRLFLLLFLLPLLGGGMVISPPLLLFSHPFLLPLTHSQAFSSYHFHPHSSPFSIFFFHFLSQSWPSPSFSSSHCDACKLIGGGAAYTMNTLAGKSDVNITKGELKEYVYRGDSGMLLRFHFGCLISFYFFTPAYPFALQENP